MQKSKIIECIVPETLDGWATLHEFYQIDWPALNALTDEERNVIVSEAKELFMRFSQPVGSGDSGFFSVLGHKADLMILHFRPTLDDLNQLELDLRKTHLFDFLIETTSYVSFVELGMYAMTQKIFDELLEKNLQPESDEWNKLWKERLDDQYNRMKGRIYPTVPEDRYVCFYPMNKRRGEKYNWYTENMNDRSSMMLEHGMIGRKYAGQVNQIIS